MGAGLSMTPPPRRTGSFPEAGPNWAEACLDVTAGVAHRTFARREDPGHRREGLAQFHNHPPPHSNDLRCKRVEYSYTQSGYYRVLTAYAHFQNFASLITHTKCLAKGSTAFKITHLKSKHLSYIVNTFAIILDFWIYHSFSKPKALLSWAPMYISVQDWKQTFLL